MPEANFTPRPIAGVAAELQLTRDDYEPYGWHKAKLAEGLAERLGDRPRGRLIGVTAISPTPLGEGKTVVSIGLAMALCRLGHRAIVTLREPSLAPVFGIKGGGAGGGAAQLLPRDDINLHFTGDLHAVTSATNLLAAMLDNHVKRRQSPRIAPDGVTWRRCVDMSDKGLTRIVTGLGGWRQAPVRETGFDLTAASEVMAILALATDRNDLRKRLGRIVVGRSDEGTLVTAEEIGAAGAMATLMNDAVRPNLVQTCEGTPALVHAGPFANIAHGNSSVIADRVALRLADYVVTESGFGADCGAEKFVNIKCRVGGLEPAAEVVVCTVRALKLHSGRLPVPRGGKLPPEYERDDPESVRAGAANLRAHVENVRSFGIPVVVAVNRFPGDTERELEEVARQGREAGAHRVAITDAFARGSEASVDLAEAVVNAAQQPHSLRFTYDLAQPVAEKFEAIARSIYGADRATFEPRAARQLKQFEEDGYGDLPVCIAKTQYSLSHDPTLRGRPRGFEFPIREVRLAAGAGFLYALSGDMVTMPGLPSTPAAMNIDIDSQGRITGLR
ncbi:formate--tetrahydrofolate ligase [Maioricimonas sp. JC845]|uniref:formate--tetrahydrofolate ligase n=1 Tax=Maioricimonas sp. JC845 TaxID=3232138 RepID=UPI003459DA97